ncbi:hypothetical protein SAMN05661044_04436 [Olivibacter domesticus]|uniref:Uncharacterized protein n=1 Tax=Olivibacter domesticus TaxID=407022 RepID=A0A1H7W7D9_OLID1|nr:hypothetical protein SAMN05661044_04436 [Olivibacter domesticus]
MTSRSYALQVIRKPVIEYNKINDKEVHFMVSFMSTMVHFTDYRTAFITIVTIADK